MQTFAFITSVPLRRHALPSQALQSSDIPRTPTCVTKPPPRKRRHSNTHPSSNKRKRKSTTPLNPVHPPAERITAAQLSEKLSQAVGFNLILKDVSRLTDYLRSFVKPRDSERPEQNRSNDSESHTETQTGLTVPTEPQTYVPKSATATKIATKYTAARGAVDRALQVLSIQAKTYVNTFAQVAGDTVYKLLSIGHEAFPALGLDNAKNAVTDALRDGWTPLSVFQWQLSAAPSENIEQRREARIQQISRFFRGRGMDSFLNVTGAALTGVGKAAEKMAPVMAKGVGRATSKYVQRSRKAPKMAAASNAVIHEQKRHKQRHQEKSSQHEPQLSWQSSNTIESDAAGASVATLQLQYTSFVPSANPTEEHGAIPGISRDSCEVNSEGKSGHRAESDEKTSTAVDGRGRDAVEEAQKENTHVFRNGAIVLAAGAVASAAASVSVPTAITCSTLMVASMALSGAKAANASELQIRERHRARQSRSVQNLESTFMKTPVMPTVKPKEPRALLAHADENTRRDGVLAPAALNSLVANTKALDSTPSGAIEAPAYAVSPSQPRIMSMPFVGVLLNWLDVMAYHVEGLVGTVLRRSGLRFTLNDETAGWKLLRSFQGNSQRITHPD